MSDSDPRRNRILGLIGRNGYETIGSLARVTGVSGMTIRRDLERLETEGLVRRTHGGAVSQKLGQIDLHYQIRQQRLSREKRGIGHAAAKLVRDDEVIYLDAGTTVLAMAEFLSGRRNLTVVTPSLPAAEKLSGNPEIEVFLLGGQMKRELMSAVGPRSEEFLSTFRIDITFLGAGAFDSDRGLCRATTDEISLKRLASKLAKRTIVVTDHTKLDVRGAIYFLPATDIDVLITDKNFDAKGRAALKRHGVKLIIAQ